MTDSLTFIRHHRTAYVAVFALALVGALVGLACTRQPAAQASTPGSTAGVPPPHAAVGATPAPVAVNCGPGQQALIRSSQINNQAVSQVECVAASAAASSARVSDGASLVAPAAVTYPSDASVQRVSGVSDVETVRVVERPVYREAARPASYRTAEYTPEQRRVSRGRSWQKSALVIGASSGVGAGVGAAAGGKKGALIGAAIGGGGAAIWDQVTRR